MVGESGWVNANLNRISAGRQAKQALGLVSEREIGEHCGLERKIYLPSKIRREGKKGDL